MKAYFEILKNSTPFKDFEESEIEYVVKVLNLSITSYNKNSVIFNQGDMVNGVTISAGGFFGPQGRKLRIPLEDPDQNDKIMNFKHEGHLITNFEMEGSALAGLARLLGHKAMTVCMVIANRRAHEANTNYKNSIDDLIVKVLERI